LPFPQAVLTIDNKQHTFQLQPQNDGTNSTMLFRLGFDGPRAGIADAIAPVELKERHQQVGCPTV
jgi:hypothetical protein